MIKEFGIPAFYSEISKFTLIGAKDSKGETHFLIYDAENNTYKLYNENKASEQLLYIEKMDDSKDGFSKQNKTINGASYEVLVSDKDPTIILVKAMNIKTGDIHLYQYDEVVGSYIIYNDSLVTNLEQEIQKYKDVILYFTIALGVAAFLILILFFRRPKEKKSKKVKEELEEIKEEVKIEELKIEEETKEEPVVEEKMTKKQKKQEKKNKKKNKKVQEEKVEVLEEKQEEVKVEQISKKEKKPSKKTLEEAMQQVNNATSIIEEYEKTIQLNKKELERKKKELDEKEQNKEETMYDIFEDDRKKKKR